MMTGADKPRQMQEKKSLSRPARPPREKSHSCYYYMAFDILAFCYARRDIGPPLACSAHFFRRYMSITMLVLADIQALELPPLFDASEATRLFRRLMHISR